MVRADRWLSLEERDIRLTFEAARGVESSRIAALWPKLVAARRRAARARRRVLVYVRLAPPLRGVVEYARADLRSPHWEADPRAARRAPLLTVDADCDLMTRSLRRGPCVAPGCPHALRGYVTQKDNPNRYVYKALVRAAGPQPKVPR